MNKLIALLLVAVPLCAQTRVAQFHVVSAPPAPPAGVPVWDSVSASTTDAPTPMMWTHYSGSGDNKALLVHTFYKDSAYVTEEPVDSVVVTHTSGRFVGTRVDSVRTDWPSPYRTEAWIVTGLPTGADTVKVYLRKKPQSWAYSVASSYSNVHQTTPTGNTFTEYENPGDTTATGSISSADGELVVGFVNGDNYAVPFNPGAGVTARQTYAPHTGLWGHLGTKLGEATTSYALTYPNIVYNNNVLLLTLKGAE